MDFSTVFLLLIPLLALYVRTPDGQLGAGEAAAHLGWVVASSAAWLGAGLVAFRLYVRRRVSRAAAAHEALLKVGKANALFTYGLSALFFAHVHVWFLKEAFERLLFSSELFIVSDLLLLSPFLVPFLVFRAYVGRVGLLARGLETTFSREVGRQARAIGILLVPQLLYLNLYRSIVSDVPYLSGWFDEHPVFGFAVAGSLLFLLFLLSPYFVRMLFVRADLRQAPGAQQLLPHLDGLAKRTGVALDRVYVWLTQERRIANAAVSGLFRRQRAVFVTDHLLDSLAVPEIVAVLAHEIGHTRLKHLMFNFLLALTSGVFVIWGLVGLSFLFETTGQEQAALQVVLLEAVYILFVFGAFAKRFEKQADLYAAHVTGDARLVAGALLKLSSANHVPVTRASLTHPSVHSRIRALGLATQRFGGSLERAVQRARNENRIIAAVLIGLLLSTFLAVEYLPL